MISIEKWKKVIVWVCWERDIFRPSKTSQNLFIRFFPKLYKIKGIEKELQVAVSSFHISCFIALLESGSIVNSYMFLNGFMEEGVFAFPGMILNVCYKQTEF